MSFLLFLPIFAIVFVLIILLSLLNFIRNLFSFGKRKQRTTEAYENSKPAKEKIFKANEGEYVDYEDVK